MYPSLKTSRQTGPVSSVHHLLKFHPFSNSASCSLPEVLEKHLEIKNWISYHHRMPHISLKPPIYLDGAHSTTYSGIPLELCSECRFLGPTLGSCPGASACLKELLPSLLSTWVHSVSSWCPAAFTGNLQVLPSPRVWLQDCPPGPQQWIISVCAHHSPWMPRRRFWLMSSVILILPEDSLLGKGRLLSPRLPGLFHSSVIFLTLRGP